MGIGRWALGIGPLGIGPLGIGQLGIGQLGNWALGARQARGDAERLEVVGVGPIGFARRLGPPHAVL